MSTVWYFAYGSNMQSATLRGRRGIHYRRAHAARAPGWHLVFDKPSLLRDGTGFANLVPAAGDEAFGVAFELEVEDMAHIDLTEGVLIGNYRRVPVEVFPLSGPDCEALRAFTLTSEHRDPGARPSRRYMGLLVEGAVEHGLPAAYVDFLRGVPAIEESPESAALQPMIDELLRR